MRKPLHANKRTAIERVRGRELAERYLLKPGSKLHLSPLGA